MTQIQIILDLIYLIIPNNEFGQSSSKITVTDTSNS